MARARMQSLTARIALVFGLAGLAPSVVAAQLATAQLSDNAALEDRQGALARVPAGKVIRLRLADGGRAGGPIVRWTAYTVTLGPYMGYAERDTFVALSAIDTMWFRGRSTHNGALFGGIAGGAVGVALGASASKLCPGTSSGSCAEGALRGAVGGVLIGGLIGAVVGSGTPRWQRLHPRHETRLPGWRAGREVVLTAPSTSDVPDPRMVALSRARMGALVRVQFTNAPDLAGYVGRAGARRATLAAVVGGPPDRMLNPVSIDSVDAIWERGTARRTGSILGGLLGFTLGTLEVIEETGCRAGDNCTEITLSNGLLAGLVGWVLGGQVGSAFPKWERRF
jgi:hypothetical protein